ncbi:MAG: WD40 repeat domain-containing protein, partial [Planctomycetaceae bacterium]|nr:WD40 repeat domain-containing protein [Planctomycetaceae bacterium]
TIGEATAILPSACGRFEFTRSGEEIALIVGSQILLIDPDDGTVHAEFKSHARVDSLQLTADDRWLISGTTGGNGIRIWDRQTGKLIKELNPQWRSAAVDASPVSKTLIAGTEGEIAIYRAGDWKQLQKIVSDQRPAANRIRFRYSADGQLLACCHVEYLPELRDPSTGKTLIHLIAPFPERVGEFALSPDGTHLAIACDHNLHLWQIDSLRSQLAELGLDWD